MAIQHICTYINMCIHQVEKLSIYDNIITRKLGKHSHGTYEDCTTVSTLFSLISCVYRDLQHWRSNQQPQHAKPKLFDWATSPCHI